MEIMSETWALYIDEEGFGNHWNDYDMEAFRGLNAIMLAIFRLGTKVFPDVDKRLFCHQFGDGFLVKTDGPEEDLTRAALIAIAVQRHVLAQNRVARASLAEGNVSDVEGCYPKEVLKAQLFTSDFGAFGAYSLGNGTLTTTPVMGKGLIEANRLNKNPPKGPLFIANAALQSRLSSTIPTKTVGDDILLINWLKGEPEGLLDIQECAGLDIESEEKRKKRLTDYLENNLRCSDDWRKSVKDHLL